MGCDIHVHFEYKKNGKWINCDKFSVNPDMTKDEFDNYDGFVWGNKWFNETVAYSRNYEAFGLLAGVRSTGEMIKTPAGLPDDMHWLTKEIADKDFDENCYGCHTPSYYYAGELFDWRRKRKAKWKKALKKVENGDKVYSINSDDYTEWIEDETGCFVIEKNYKVLDYIINEIKASMSEHLYCWDKADFEKEAYNFRMVFWFDS